MKKTKPEIYNTLRAFLLVAIFASCTIACILEQSANAPIEAAEPAGGIGRWDYPLPADPIPEETPETPEPELPDARYPLTADERYHIEAVVSAESRGEDFNGQCLIAQCILNTLEATDKTVYEVLYEPYQYAEPNYDEHHLVSDAVAAVFDDGYEVTEEPVRYFYAPARCYSEWHENSLELVMEHGGHRFFKEA